MFEIWHVEFVRFSPCVTSRWCRDKAIVLEKESIAYILQFEQFKYRERCLSVYTLARKGTAITFIAEVRARCFL